MPMFKSISARTAFRVILVSLPILVAVVIGVTDMAVRQQEGEILLRGKALAKSGAAMYGTALQRGVATGALKWEDVANPTYTLIRFSVPVAEPRFRSTFDWYTDQFGIQGIEDAMTASDPMLLYAVGNDLTGYIPTTISAFSHPPTGDARKDAVNARSKRRFETPMHKAAAAWTGSEPLVQEYHRDTGHVAWDVAQPIWLRNPTTGKALHWGSFRVGVRQDRIAEVRNEVILRLGGVFLFFEVILAGVMYLSIRAQMRPLRDLSSAAEAVSTGEHEDPIGPRPDDPTEITEMALALRRLQNSLRYAMARLRPDGEPRHPTQNTEVLR